MTNEITEQVIKTSMFFGFFTTTMGALSVEVWLAIGGFVLTAVSLVVNSLHKRAMQRIEQQRVDNEKMIERQKLDIERHKAGLPPLER